MAQTLHLDVRALKLENPPYDFDTAFRNAAAGAAQMVLVLSSPFFTEHRTRIAELGIEYRLPTMFAFRHYVDAGGLISYGADFPPMYRRAADYVAKIVKGEKAADLPIEQATKFETVVNLKTASPYRSSRSRHWSRARIRQARAALQPSGNDLTYRFPLIVESVARLRPRSCIIDGEAVVCDGNGMVSFDHIRYRRHDASAFLYAFDLIELNGDDLRRDPLKARKASLANIMARAGHGIWFNDHIEEDGETVFRHACKMGPSKASCRSGRTLPIEAADHPIGLK